MTRLLAGIHPVREALRAGRPLEKILLNKGSAGPRFQEIVDLSRAASIPIRFESHDVLDRTAKGVPHQGVIAFGVTREYVELAAVLPSARLLVILDGVEDPHNLGAIVRTAHAAALMRWLCPNGDRRR